MTLMFLGKCNPYGIHLTEKGQMPQLEITLSRHSL